MKQTPFNGDLLKACILICCVETEPVVCFYSYLSGRSVAPKIMTNYVILGYGIQVLYKNRLIYMIQNLWMMCWLKTYCNVECHID